MRRIHPMRAMASWMCVVVLSAVSSLAVAAWPGPPDPRVGLSECPTPVAPDRPGEPDRPGGAAVWGVLHMMQCAVNQAMATEACFKGCKTLCEGRGGVAEVSYAGGECGRSGDCRCACWNPPEGAR